MAKKNLLQTIVRITIRGWLIGRRMLESLFDVGERGDTFVN